MNTVRVSKESVVRVAELANKEGLTIPEATERLIQAGFARIHSLKKWRRKEKRARTIARRRAAA